MTNSRYAALKAMGRCTACGKQKADRGYTTCLQCRLEARMRGETHSDDAKRRHALWLARRRDLLYAFGVCVVCGKHDIAPGKKLCHYCLAKARQRAQDKRLARDVTPRCVMDGIDLCARCGKPKTDNGHKVCNGCYDALKRMMLHARACRTKPNYFERAHGYYVAGR